MEWAWGHRCMSVCACRGFRKKSEIKCQPGNEQRIFDAICSPIPLVQVRRKIFQVRRTIMSRERLLIKLVLICVVCAPWDAQSQDPLFAKSYYKRAQSEYDKGNITQALEEYNKSISINPKVAKAYY